MVHAKARTWKLSVA